MAFEYIGALLEEAVQSTASVEVRGRVEQVVGTIIRAVVPGVRSANCASCATRGRTGRSGPRSWAS